MDAPRGMMRRGLPPARDLALLTNSAGAAVTELLAREAASAGEGLAIICFPWAKEGGPGGCKKRT
jgi:hypothetical protein